MAREKSSKDNAQALFHSLRSAYAATPLNLKVVYMASVGSFPFNSFLSGVLSCVGTAVLAVCLRIQVNKENKEFKLFSPFIAQGFSWGNWALYIGHPDCSLWVQHTPNPADCSRIVYFYHWLKNFKIS
ncbi:Dolichyl-diphosphooligosaccharide--protein glycosyltransferase subunit DAD1 [Hibiscus syriacus]|uniref:Dolichyl-diphosphooligosaccharide--protein glycosyltransferase subunit DAD1 n=1 Tax=Hibiscus syriacus TaxID=106335 RepID=A0A6A3BK13_HIBSY|nr:Dolichyl-diphosphooligosaccharide--protein glycosyltransferase subunit DAD1 [Hibiscus syriacus]